MPKLGELTPEQKRNYAKGGAGALALAAMAAMLGTWEGKRNDPYRDVVGIRTVCYGETRVVMRHYSDRECAMMLVSAAKPFLIKVAQINPRLQQKPLEWAAHATLAYNIGVGNYAKSTTARLFYNGQDAAACRAIGRYVYAGGRPWKGLVLRRNGDRTRYGEIELCLSGVG